MKKEPANSHSPENPATINEIYFVLPAGLIPGAIIDQETIRKAQEAERRFEERKRDRNNKPPKPPRRPNAPLGRLAVGNT